MSLGWSLLLAAALGVLCAAWVIALCEAALRRKPGPYDRDDDLLDDVTERMKQ